MAIRKIAQLGHPVLRQRARAISAEELAAPATQQLIDDLIETMHDANGAGLAAPQVHESVRICVLEVDGNPRYPELPALPLTVLVNPVVEPLLPAELAGVRSWAELPDRECIVMYEGCLSVSGLRGQVRRPRRVRVTALDRAGAPLELSFEGLPAAVVQHETDHLDGVLYVDRADPRTLAFLSEFGRYVPVEQRVRDGANTGGAA